MSWNLSPIPLQSSHSECSWSSASSIVWSFGDFNTSDFDAHGRRGATFSSDSAISAGSNSTHIPTLVRKVSFPLTPRQDPLPWVQKSNNHHPLRRYIPRRAIVTRLVRFLIYTTWDIRVERWRNCTSHAGGQVARV